MLEALALRAQAVHHRDGLLREQVERLDAERQRRYYEAYARLLKDPDTYATLNWLAFAGLHHFYLGKWVRGGVNLGTMFLGVFFIFVVPGGLLVGILLLCAVTLVELPALFRSQLIVEDHNVSLGERLLRELSPVGAVPRRI